MTMYTEEVIITKIKSGQVGSFHCSAC